jgi:hypothetical protein
MLLELMFRLKRFIAVKYPWLSEDTCWQQVDEIIKDNSKVCQTLRRSVCNTAGKMALKKVPDVQ